MRYVVTAGTVHYDKSSLDNGLRPRSYRVLAQRCFFVRNQVSNNVRGSADADIGVSTWRFCALSLLAASIISALHGCRSCSMEWEERKRAATRYNTDFADTAQQNGRDLCCTVTAIEAKNEASKVQSPRTFFINSPVVFLTWCYSYLLYIYKV